MARSKCSKESAISSGGSTPPCWRVAGVSGAVGSPSAFAARTADAANSNAVPSNPAARATLRNLCSVLVFNRNACSSSAPTTGWSQSRRRADSIPRPACRQSWLSRKPAVCRRQRQGGTNLSRNHEAPQQRSVMDDAPSGGGCVTPWSRGASCKVTLVHAASSCISRDFDKIFESIVRVVATNVLRCRKARLEPKFASAPCA
jgi:hypothetical protein